MKICTVIWNKQLHNQYKSEAGSDMESADDPEINDLEHYVNEIFTIDNFKSKTDEDVSF